MTQAGDTRGSKLVLFVDDEPALRKLVQRAFADRPFRLEVAVDGKDGLRKAQELKPDLIITDITMPELDGIGLAKAVKASAEISEIPIIFLTGKGDPSSIEDGVDGGEKFYLSKPFTLSELISKVETALGI